MLQYLDDTQVNWKTGMHPFISISRGGLHVPFIGTSMGGWGWGCYDLNIESQINLTGNAIIKILLSYY